MTTNDKALENLAREAAEKVAPLDYPDEAGWLRVSRKQMVDFILPYLHRAAEIGREEYEGKLFCNGIEYVRTGVTRVPEDGEVVLSQSGFAVQAFRCINPYPILRPVPDAPNPHEGIWRCSCCGEMMTAENGSEWRWNGTIWEHNHNDKQAGYFPARRFDAPKSDASTGIVPEPPTPQTAKPIPGTKNGIEFPAPLPDISEYGYHWEGDKFPIAVKNTPQTAEDVAREIWGYYSECDTYEEIQFPRAAAMIEEWHKAKMDYAQVHVNTTVNAALDTIMRLTNERDGVASQLAAKDAEIAELKKQLARAEGARDKHYADLIDAGNTIQGLRDKLKEHGDIFEEDSRLRNEIAELKDSADLHIECSERARNMWQKAHPDKAHMWPDGAENMVWLMEQIDAKNAEIRETKTQLERAGQRITTLITERDNLKDRVKEWGGIAALHAKQRDVAIAERNRLGKHIGELNQRIYGQELTIASLRAGISSTGCQEAHNLIAKMKEG